MRIGGLEQCGLGLALCSLQYIAEWLEEQENNGAPCFLGDFGGRCNFRPAGAMLDCNATPVLSHVSCFDESDIAAAARGFSNFGQWVGLFPRVIIAGPPRSGTTALLRGLWQH